MQGLGCCLRARYRPRMRSMDTTPTPAERFGALVQELAPRAGYDLTPNAGGRAALARDTGMSTSAVGRMIAGKTLPMPAQFEAIARALNADVRSLLVAAEVISATAWPKTTDPDVLSVTRSSPLSPEEAADAWGITDPMVRRFLLSTIREAMRLQRETTEPTTAHRTAP